MTKLRKTDVRIQHQAQDFDTRSMVHKKKN